MIDLLHIFMPKKVLISIIGDPRNYKPARYRYAGAWVKGKFSSSVVMDVEKPDETVLISQYTMAKEGSKFEDLQVGTIEYMKKFIGDVDRFRHKIIAPGVVRVRDKEREYVYMGGIFNFYAYVLYSLARFFEGLSGDIEVVLDLTHGINYMGYLTLRAVNLVLDVYSMVKDVTLKIVNSDPYPQGWEGQTSPDLYMNVVLEKVITPTLNYPASWSVGLFRVVRGRYCSCDTVADSVVWFKRARA